MKRIETTFMTIMRDQLEKYKVENLLTLTDLSAEMGMSAPTVRHFLLDPRLVRYQTVVKVKNFLDTKHLTKETN